MRKEIILVVFGILCNIMVFAQANVSPQRVAQKQAQMLKDSVGIDQNKMQQIYTINVNVNYAKLQARNTYASQPVLMQNIFQRQENIRDSIYQTVLSPAEFTLYSNKKNTILNAY